jgi:PEP-CTERM motif
MFRTRFAMLAATWTLTFCDVATAESVSIAPTKDTSMFSNNPTRTAGGYDVFYVGKNSSGDTRRALLEFDVAGNVPAGSTITGAALTLYLNDWSGSGGFGADRTIGVHRTTSAWGDGTTGSGGSTGGGGQGVDSAEDGDVSWTYRSWSTTDPTPPHLAWSTAGGDYEAVASASLTISDSPTPVTIDSPHTWSGAGLVSDVQAWLDGTLPNDGWLVRELETDVNVLIRFYSSEYATAGLRPVLDIDYVPVPEPATWILLTAGLVAIGCARQIQAHSARPR